MPTFRNQIRVKCELNIVELVKGLVSWGGVGGGTLELPKIDRGSKALGYPIWTLALNWKILFGEQIHNCSKSFLFNKLTENPLHMLQLLSFIRPSSFQLD